MCSNFFGLSLCGNGIIPVKTPFGADFLKSVTGLRAGKIFCGILSILSAFTNFISLEKGW
jgi:hypothetical protein